MLPSTLRLLCWCSILAFAIGLPLSIQKTSNAFKSFVYNSRTCLDAYPQQTRCQLVLRSSLSNVPQGSKDNINSVDKIPSIVFPGGGIFFYWQIGAALHLRESKYDLAKIPMAGASAGALAATLTVSGVDFVQATNLALDLADEAGVWERPLGLQGVWGPLIQRWLEELLPDDAAEIANERLALLVTPIPSFGKNRIDRFQDKTDLVRCNMASVHLPWFLDGNLVFNFRDSPHIDGSFLSKPEDYFPNSSHDVVTLDWTKDPIMAAKKNDLVKLTSKEGIWSMIDQGREYASKMEIRGDFNMLPLK